MIPAFKKASLDHLVRSPHVLVVGGFAALILVGALVLMLPWAHQPGKVTFVDALFTSTSAVCVTGLAVVDTGTDYTFFGQVTILVLIQAGGLGVMTFAALAFGVVGRRLSLQSQALVYDSFFQRDQAMGFQNTFRAILVLTFCIEGVGALLLIPVLDPGSNLGAAVFSAVFHAVSAFCNAGFSVRSDNLVGVRDSALFVWVIMTLIVLGGLGFTVLHEIWDSSKDPLGRKDYPTVRRFSLHARLVLAISGGLIVGGALMLLVFGLTSAEVTFHDKVVHALFQSVSARTAGFNTIDLGNLPSASLLAIIVLMFIGGSPGSCAGGVKTTSMAIWWASMKAGLRGEKEAHLLDRRLPHEFVGRTHLLLGLAVLWNIIGALVLLSTETHTGARAIDLLFEQISAFGTVGLSTGVTPKLSDVGKLWLVVTMFVGRLGPLTIVVWMIPKAQVSVNYPKGTVMIG
jgi:trk system potassium uptake protein